jgi:predicted RND superfamily exporter protein
LKYKPKEPKTDQCYAVGTGACDSIADSPEKGLNIKNEKKKSFSYGQFLTNVSVKIAKNPIPLLVIFGCIAFVGFQIDPLIPVQTSENAFVPGDMPAKINIDKVTRILGATSTADFYVQGYVTDLDTVRWIGKFQEYELSHHPELPEQRVSSLIFLHITLIHCRRPRPISMPCWRKSRRTRRNSTSAVR